MEVTIPEDHHLAVDLPATIQSGPARLILLIPPREEPTPRRRLRLEDLPKRDGLNCTFDELVATSWEKEWRPDP
jgi:hypothetical protein